MVRHRFPFVETPCGEVLRKAKRLGRGSLTLREPRHDDGFINIFQTRKPDDRSGRHGEVDVSRGKPRRRRAVRRVLRRANDAGKQCQGQCQKTQGAAPQEARACSLRC